MLQNPRIDSVTDQEMIILQIKSQKLPVIGYVYASFIYYLAP
jgi:hypothetical protein